MRTTKRSTKADRRLKGRIRPQFDRLEPRLALSGTNSILPSDSGLDGSSTTQSSNSPINSTLSIVSTDPTSSSNLASSPTTLTVTFDRPVDDFSIGNADFELLHVESDGTTQPLSLGEAQLIENLDPNDPTGSQISLDLTKPLLDGHYQLLVLGSNQLAGLDGTSLASDGTDTVISDFTIGSKSNGLDSAVDLGTPTSTDTVHSDVLDLSSNPTAVNYYKVTLASGHQWRLGLEVLLTGKGGSISTTLSLFDSQGKLVTTSSVGTESDPGDPYLFAGLGPGVYYVGLSARGNVPDSSGVYNQSGQSVAGSASSQTGGPYQLHVVADPADQPTRVLGLQLNHDDPLSKDPTGLTVQFNGSIQLATLKSATVPAVDLIDQNGRVWSMTPTQYTASAGQLSFLFDQTLPAGVYSFELTGSGGLVDLAGRAPVAPGLPQGVLGTFRVQPTVVPKNDLGALLPTIAETGLKANLALGSQSTLVKHFTIVAPGVYSLTGLHAVTGVGFTLTDANSKIVASSSNTTPNDSFDVFLAGGAYTLTLTNSNHSPAVLPIIIEERGILFSQLLDGGVAQGPAFSLRLVTPVANFGQTSDSDPGATTPVPSLLNNDSTGASPPSTSPNFSGSGSASAGQETGGTTISAVPGSSATATPISSPGSTVSVTLSANKDLTGPTPTSTNSTASGSVSAPSGQDSVGFASPSVAGYAISAGPIAGASIHDGSTSSAQLAIGTITPVGPSPSFLLFGVGPVG